jgi:hypothetical protein
MTNISNLFNFIESNRPEYKTPHRVKFIYNPESLTKDDLNVKGDLGLSKTSITTLPDNLTVGGYLDLSSTPLSKQYSKDEIRKMIQDKGGNVEGRIF